jgi:hypothetical protein
MRKIDSRSIAALLGLILMLGAFGLYALEVSRYPSLTVFEGRPIGGDFYTFWAAGQLIVQGLSEGVYVSQMLSLEVARLNLEFARLNREVGMLLGPIYYPPMYLLVLGALGFLPYFAGLLTLFLSTGALYFLGLWQLVRQRWILLFMCGFAGVWLNLVAGQNGMLTAGLMALALSQLNKNQMLAGLFIGLSCYKPHLCLLWPLVLLAGGYYRAFFFAGLTILGLIAYTLIVFGFETWILYSHGAEFAMRAMAEQAKIWIRMPTLYAMLRLQMVDYTWALQLQIVFDLFIAAIVVIIWRRTQDLALRGAALATGTLLATPFVYDYDYAILGIALVLLLKRATERGWTMADKILLPLAYIWPIAINHLAMKSHAVFGAHWQLGFLLPVALLLLVYARVVMDSRPVPALKQVA